MGQGKTSGKVTTREKEPEPTRDTKPKFTGVLTEQMVDKVLNNEINNVAENKNAEIREVVKKVADTLNRTYGVESYQARGKFVELNGKRIEIKKKKNGLFDAVD